jgi:hypothetical protein
MIDRLSETLPAIRAAAEKRKWPARTGERALLEVVVEGKRYAIDVKEHTGPVYWPNLRNWMGRFGERSQILMTMGFFPDKAIGQLLNEPELARRVALVAMGLTSFFEMEFKPKKFGQTETPLFLVVEDVLARRDIQLQGISCHYCAGRPLTSCQICGALSCKSHFIVCPLCRAYLCHPDVRDCYFKHEC